MRLVGQTGDRCYALSDKIVERQSIYNGSFVTDDPRVHHRQHRIAQLCRVACAGTFPLLDHDEDLQVTPCTSTRSSLTRRWRRREPVAGMGSRMWFDRSERWNPDGYYIVAEHPNGNYLVDDPNWLANLLDLAAGVKLRGARVVPRGTIPISSCRANH